MLTAFTPSTPRRLYSPFWTFFIFAGMIFLSGCLFTYSPPLIPLQVEISPAGQVTVAINGEVQTPLGTFGVEWGGWEIFPEKRTLTIVLDNYSIVYEVPKDQKFDFQFIQEGLYYVHLQKEPDGNLLLELHSQDYTPEQNNSFCPGAPPSRMKAGDKGRVTYTTGLRTRLRSGPGLQRSIKRLLEEGTTFTVIEGPVCADSYNWWHIRLWDTEGWIAEGEYGNYFIEPYP